ncbi:N-acetylneuraminate synthase family protein [Cryomorphaceae bacterium 1068]|nr:N-acetylneuraminate synthase family protein [Cryomorphaceae bacterium 1068]
MVKNTNNQTYLIGEIGQNHNGSVDIAKLIVDAAAREVEEQLFGLTLKGMDAVKLTKRDLKYELSDSQMRRPYNTPNSFGKTYGEHREVLELSDEEHFEVYKYAKALGLDFVETLCAPSCTSILRHFSPDYLKVASRDLTNLPLLEVLAETKLPIIVSTGMAGEKELDQAVEVITKHHDKLSILHCVSEYPTHPQNVNLKTITYLQKKYPNYGVGYSDHTVGISVPVAAVAMGATIIEKHITLDRRMKGTDQRGSLGPDGLNRMVRDIRLLEMELGEEKIFIADGVQVAKEKLERSVATNRIIASGETITAQDIHLLSPGDGYKWSEKANVIGKKTTKEIPANEVIYPKDLQS